MNPQRLVEQYPEEIDRMVQAYLANPAAIENAENPLLEAAQLGGAAAFLEDFTGTEPPLDPTTPASNEDSIP
jgi:hypothetical protein